MLPNVLGKETCQHVQYIVTDGDSQEINAVQNACTTVCPNAVQNTGLWHMVILGMNSKSKITNDCLKKLCAPGCGIQLSIQNLMMNKKNSLHILR